MNENREYVDYLEDIADAAEKAQRFVAGMDYEAFISSPLKKSIRPCVRPLQPMAAFRSLDESREFASFASLALGHNGSDSAAKRLYQRTVRDEKTAFAVVRALEIIGEATKKVPEEICLRYSGVPWRLMAGMRDKLIHDYSGVNLEVVWKTVIEDVPGLTEGIRGVLDEERKGG